MEQCDYELTPALALCLAQTVGQEVGKARSVLLNKSNVLSSKCPSVLRSQSNVLKKVNKMAGQNGLLGHQFE